MLPPFSAYKSLLAEVEDINGNLLVQLPKKLFEMILQEATKSLPYDENYYFSENLDLASVRDTNPKFDGHDHFTRAGYLEGRKPANFEIDQRWYLRTYPDVAAAVEKGSPISAAEHFNQTGWAEMRAPNAKSFAVVADWADLIKAGK